jgi:hypothetical protein
MKPFQNQYFGQKAQSALWSASFPNNDYTSILLWPLTHSAVHWKGGCSDLSQVVCAPQSGRVFSAADRCLTIFLLMDRPTKEKMIIVFL